MALTMNTITTTRAMRTWGPCTPTPALPPKLTGLEATPPALYPSLEKLSVQGILPTGQTAAELTPSANKLGW